MINSFKGEIGKLGLFYDAAQKMHFSKSPLSITSGLLSHSETF